jgi:uncharacterized protein YbjT (DUF2867 family)
MTGTRPRVLILGADGFIGRHLAFGLRRDGWDVIACARRPGRLEQMGFVTLRADLSDPRSHDPGFWAPHLAADATGPVCVVNAAGLLSGPEGRMAAVHAAAPGAVYAAMADGARGVLISAVGIDAADTGFARHRRAGEAVAARHDITILRAGLVLADTSYGGSSLARALACLPGVTPVVGDGDQPFNPIHADDLALIVATCLRAPPPPGPHPVGGPEVVTQTDMLRTLRRWIGLRPVPVLPLPVPLARLIGGIGDALRLGPISRSAVDQLSAGVLAEPDMAPLGPQPRGFSEFVAARPAGSQDLWHARLYLLRPLLRLMLAVMWLISGLIGLGLPAADFLPLVKGSGLSDSALVVLARVGGLADLAIALALLRGWRLRAMAWVQGALIAGYTLVFTALAPGLWLLPLGGLLKNLPLLVLIALHGVLEDER